MNINSLDQKIQSLLESEATISKQITLLHKEIAVTKMQAICEILGIKMGDVVKIEFGDTNYKWKLVDYDIQGVNVYLVNKSDSHLRSRTLFYQEAREGKYIITK